MNRILLGAFLWMLLLYRAIARIDGPQKEDRIHTALSGVETETGQENEIRVVLMDTEYTSCYHPFVTVSYRGKTITLKPDSPELKDGSFAPDTGEEGFSVLSIERSCGVPRYQGSLTIYSEEEGLVLVNTLPLEDYLKSVVPSEMPASFEKEALKAQAICARTYAARQMEDRRREEYHADVDDSVACQVYGNIEREEKTDQAVDETAGLVLTQEGELIEAYYFSTSPGQTSTNEIWNEEERLPYLQSVPCSFDARTPWSSWQVVIPWENLQEELLPILEPEQIRWEDPMIGESGGSAVTLEHLQLEGLEVTKTSQSGAATELTVVVEDPSLPACGTVKIGGEYQIRKALAPSGCIIHKQDRDTVVGGALLPSAYISLAAEQGSHVEIRGKGYGHGVGMSQTAADEMAREGFSCEEILHYFYHLVEIGAPDTKN
ncbi:MAG: SpoIID/LytB domain-containing protein [Blautia sp.]|nr:SpoIID/LytB domain-containing protein [Blautia sp.]